MRAYSEPEPSVGLLVEVHTEQPIRIGYVSICHRQLASQYLDIISVVLLVIGVW